jgi:hypothetical protein
MMEYLKNNNGIRLSANLYVADNQNGFEQCLYDYFGHNTNDPSYTKKEIREMVQNYPKYDPEWHSLGHAIYPCAFVIIDHTFECGRIYIDIIPPFSFNELVHIGPYRLL